MAIKRASVFSRYQKNLQKRLSKFNFPQSYLGLILGAIIVIVLGFLVANFLTKNSGQINGGEKVSQEPAATEFVRQYKVKEGDSLSGIAGKAYGREDMWVVLAAKNNVANPNLIYVDAAIEVPPKAEAETAFADLTRTSYDVGQGDTLFTIAQKVYGNGSRWTLLARANNVGYLPNGNPLIFAGSTLTIPR